MRPIEIWKSLAVTLWIAALLSAYFLRPSEATSRFLHVRMATTTAGAIQVYYDTGAGYNEPQSVRQPIVRPDGTAVDYRLPLPAAELRALRLDPLDAAGTVRLERVEIVEASGQVLCVADAEHFQPVNQIAALKVEKGAWIAESQGNDPSLEWRLTPPLAPPAAPLGRAARVLLGLGGLWGVVLLARWRRVADVYAPVGSWLDQHAWLPGLGLTLVSWMVLFDVPLPPAPELDASWQQVLGLAAVRHWAFGREIVFTGGPLAFLNLPYTTPETVTLRLVWDALGKLALCGLLVWALTALPLWRRVVVIWLVVGFGRMFSDAVYLFMVAVFAASWLIPATGWRKTAAGLLGVIFFGLVKFTFLLAGGLGVGMAVLAAVGRHEWRRAGLLSLGFLAGYVGCWLALGQSPGDLPAYFRLSWEVSTGYTWAMALEETRLVFWCGLGTAVWLVAGLWLAVRQNGSRVTEWCLAGFAGGLLFLSWKHGFTRAAQHVLGFFWLASLLACALPVWLHQQGRRGWFEATLPLALLGAWLAYPAVLQRTPAETAGRLRSCWHTLRAPGAFLAGWQCAEAAAAQAAALPQIKARVGAAAIDGFNYEQGVLLLNGLNYRPRPTVQGYTAYTAPLQQLNREAWRAPLAPEFVLWRATSIDDRFLPQDDALLWAELPHRYQLEGEEKGFALLRRRPSPVGVMEPREEILRQPVSPGTPVAVTASGRLWLQVTAAPSWLGKLRAALYKPGLLTLVVTDASGRELRHRLLPKVAESGFLISPVVDNQADFLAYLQGRFETAVRSVRIEVAPGQEPYWAEMELRLSRLPPVP